MKKLAIIGSGIAGLACAHFLQRYFDITLFEKNAYAGGHTNTVMVPGEHGDIPIDTGFMVFNKSTYPNLTKLFESLQIDTFMTDMSISVQNKARHIEWCGSSLNQVFGQRKNLFSPSFWRMLHDLERFNKQADKDGQSNQFDAMTVEQYCQLHKLGKDLLELYIIPMASAIWSMPPVATASFPVATLLRFFYNHRFNAGLSGHLQWYTVRGGAISYVRKLTEPLLGSIHLSKGANRVEQQDEGATVYFDNGSAVFDKVIIAAHADEALSMLARPTDLEHRLLSLFAYQKNDTVLHTDSSVMPVEKRCWAAWNYAMEPGGATSTHYWMNRLQNIQGPDNYFVSLNYNAIDQSKVLKRMQYTHPLFSCEASAAQKELPALNNQSGRDIKFCGSYFRYGFHEDALTSAIDLCQTLTGEHL
jgi:predicted NAD/FAD-binding protein